jgi:hypothetical protein
MSAPSAALFFLLVFFIFYSGQMMCVRTRVYGYMYMYMYIHL